MSKFKVGDKVKLKHSSYSDYHKGDEGVACLYEEAYNHGITIRMAKALNNDKHEWFFCDDELELVVENMNQEIEVGDVLEWKGTGRYIYTVAKIDKENNSVTYTNGGVDRLEDAIKLYTIKSKANKGEIVGYELLKDLPGIPAGTISEKDGLVIRYGHVKSTYKFKNPSTETISFYEASEVKDTTWFKPIYKPKEVVVKISKGREVKINQHDNTVTIDGTGSATYLQVKGLYDVVNPVNKDGKQRMSITSATVQYGCQEFTKEDINLVYQAIQNLK